MAQPGPFVSSPNDAYLIEARLASEGESRKVPRWRVAPSELVSVERCFASPETSPNRDKPRDRPQWCRFAQRLNWRVGLQRASTTQARDE
jgi:hypothetical protein